MIVAGVDGGATKVVCIIGDEEGNVLGVGSAGPANYHVVGLSTAKRNIRACFERALNSARIRSGDVDVGVFGIGGLTNDRDYRLVYEAVRSLNLVKEPIVVNDVVVAYYAITHGEPGVAVVAGTGSIAYGRNERGDEVRVGGWGQLLGDEGSSVYIARRAFQEACKAYDGRGPATSLTRLLPEAMGMKSLEEVAFNVMSGRISLSELGRLAPVVARAAEEGDEVARRILNEAGEELASLAIAALRRLRIKSTARVGAVGGVFKSGSWLWRPFTSKITSEFPKAKIVGPIYGGQPAAGAVFLAALKRGVRMSEEALTSLLNAIKEHS
mgnify:CR=1 FL=1